MVKEGHWFYQQTPHDRVATKPPLVGWVSSGVFALTKSWDVAWRFPSFLAAIGIMMFLFRAATSVYGSIAGLIALAAFGLNLLSPRIATLVRTDMPLALVIFLIGLLIWQRIQREEAWTPRDRVCIFALLTVAMLIKGPIVYAFLLPGIALFEWRCRRHPPEADRYSAWSGWWPWIASLGVFLLWVVGGVIFQRGFFDEVVMREFVARFGETIHRPQPLYFYLPHMLHKFAPWSLVMISITIFDLASRRWRIGAAFRDMSAETFWLLCWSLGGLVVMSLIPSKRVDRIFPIVPPLCLILAAQIGGDAALPRNLSGVGAARRPYVAIALVFSICFAGGYTIFKVISAYRDHHDALVIFGRIVRLEAEAHHWRYEALSAKDEGLLLYLRKTHFIEPDRAFTEWNRGNLDALVASTEKAPALLSELRDASLSSLKSNERNKEQGKDYVLITR